MKYLMLLAVCLVVIGCSISRTMNVSVSGTNIKTPWGKGENVEIMLNKTLEILR